MTANFSKKLEGRRGGQKEERRRLNMRVSPNIWRETLARGFQRYFSLDTLLKSSLITETRGRKFSRPKIFLKFKFRTAGTVLAYQTNTNIHMIPEKKRTDHTSQYST